MINIKKCPRCKSRKELTEFSKSKSKKDGLESVCKSCKKAYYEANKERIAAQHKVYNEANKKKRVKDYESIKHKPVVYLLVKENYVGITECISKRLQRHHYHNKRDITDYIILREFETREGALAYEKQLHNLGFNGRHITNSYK